MFRDFYTVAQELHETIKKIRNVWIPIYQKDTTLIRDDNFIIRPKFTHYRNTDGGEIEYCFLSNFDFNTKVLLHFEG